MVESVSPVSARRLETRTRLLDAALEVFAEFGLRGSSVERICSRADFSRGAFYSNFSSKEELFIALLTRQYEQRAAMIEARAADLIETMRAETSPLTRESAARYVSAFLAPGGRETEWFTLEMEFLLLALREPDGPVKYFAFGSLFQDELKRVVEELLTVAGRQFTIPAASALDVFNGVFEQALRVTALGGEHEPGGLVDLGDRIVEILFAITDPVKR